MVNIDIFCIFVYLLLTFNAVLNDALTVTNNLTNNNIFADWLTNWLVSLLVRPFIHSFILGFISKPQANVDITIEIIASLKNTDDAFSPTRI
jgi:hypothetical protein